MTDPELVELARSGDGSAFGELVSRHHRAALRAALAALGSDTEADDVVQDAWIVVQGRLDAFRGDSSFRTWLLTIVWNKALDRRRSVVRWLKRQVSLGETSAGETESAGVDSGGRPLMASTRLQGGTPEDSVLHLELRAAIRKLVRALPARLRDPLLLVGSEEYTYDEVAAMLRQPVGTVKWHVSEARRQLKHKLAGLGLGPAAGRAGAGTTRARRFASSTRKSE